MALLSRGRPPSSEKHHGADGRMSIVEHLEDLRRCLIISAIGWLVTTIVAFVFWQRILDLLARLDVHYLPLGDELLGFILLITIAFGIVFELPVVLYTLGMLRIISARWLYRHRLYWMVALGLAANFMTPGADPLTPLLVFVPLYIFWEGTTLLLKLTGH